MCENKEPKILENDHKIDSGFSDLVIMEVDGTWSTVGIQSHKALDLDKQQKIKDAYVTAPWFRALPWQQPAVQSQASYLKGGDSQVTPLPIHGC
ncbi:hypothetical protein ACQJBY_021046 [Aegilops geniculata]